MGGMSRSGVMIITVEQLASMKYLLSLIRTVGVSASHAEAVLGPTYDSVIAVSRGSSEAVVVDAGSTVYVAFQGTKDVVDVVRDLYVSMTPVTCGRVHKGFLLAYRQIRHDLMVALQRVDPLRKKTIILTGHSLGGALAAMFMEYLALNGYKLGESVVFGCPKVGDSAWRESMVRTKASLLSVVHSSDIVPLMPPFPTYRPVGRGVYLDDDGTIRDSRRVYLMGTLRALWQNIFRIPDVHMLPGYDLAVSMAIKNYVREEE